MFINYRDIPGFQNLFLDYLYEFENVSEFYTYNFRNNDDIINHLSKISQHGKYRREELSSLIYAQNSYFSISHKTEKNIRALRNDDTVAIITGQQLGILGGPLYTIYKTITAIKLANKLNEQYSKYHFVPIFWLEADDHDFDEVRRISIISDGNSIKEIRYDDSLEEEVNRGPIGKLKFNEGINNFISEFENTLIKTEFTPLILKLIKKSYKSGNTFLDGFKEILFEFFDESGLIIFDPSDAEVKKLLSPVFKHEIENFRSNSIKLVQSSARLEEVYHAQVKLRPINLFYSHEGGRYAIEPTDDGNYKLKNKRLKFSHEEIINKVETSPWMFSPNVLLRPICQDYLLPAAFYIGGPSEISYFAQLKPLYNSFKVEPSIIYPRVSATILEKNISSIISKYEISFMDLIINRENIAEKIISKISTLSVDELFARVEGSISNLLHELKLEVNEIEQTLNESGNKAEQRIISYLNEYKNKVNEAQRRKYDTVIRQVNKTVVTLFPNNELQERELNFFNFANKYGLSVLKKLIDELDISKFEHQVIEI